MPPKLKDEAAQKPKTEKVDWTRPCYVSHGEDHFEIQWDLSGLAPSMVNKKPNGLMGYARVTRRRGGEKRPGDGVTMCKYHVCSFRPCPSEAHAKSKWGWFDVPIHVRRSDWRPSADEDHPAPPEEPPQHDAAIVAPAEEDDVAAEWDWWQLAAAWESAIADSMAEPLAPLEADADDEPLAPLDSMAEPQASQDDAAIVAPAEEDDAAIVAPAEVDAAIVAPAAWESAMADSMAEPLAPLETSTESEAAAVGSAPEAAAESPEGGPLLKRADTSADRAVPPAPATAPLGERVAAPPLGDEQADAVVPPVSAPAAVFADSADPSSKVLTALLSLARSIQAPRAYIGHSAFLLFALSRQTKVFLWEGETRIDLVEVYAPWASELCTKSAIVDVVACAPIKAASGCNQKGCSESTFAPIDDDIPLEECRHWLCAARMDHNYLGEGAPGITAFYAKKNLAIMGTVVDGDCGIDACCQMAGVKEDPESRCKMRQDRELP